MRAALIGIVAGLLGSSAGATAPEAAVPFAVRTRTGPPGGSRVLRIYLAPRPVAVLSTFGANGRPTVKALRLGAGDVHRVRRAFDRFARLGPRYCSRPSEVRRPLTALEHRAAAGASRLVRYDPNEPVSPSCPSVPAEFLAVDAELRKLERRVDLKGAALHRAL